MTALRDLQVRFTQALFDGCIEPVRSDIVAHGIDIAERLDIYRNNLREGFIKALAIEFPVIERLVGKGYFRTLATDFLARHPSRSGDLHHIGAPFPQFLRERYGGGEYDYFADVAALEWAYQQALVAPDAPALEPGALRTIDPSMHEHLRFDLHPACALVRSPYPIVHIWHANRPESDANEIIDLSEGGDDVLVLRTPECIELRRLPPGDFAALDALARHESLGAALDAALSAEPGFDLGAALRRLLALNVLVGFHAPVAASSA